MLALLSLGVAVAGFTLMQSYPSRGEEDDPAKVRVPGRRSPQQERIIPAGQYLRSPGLWPSLVLLGLASAGVLWVISGLTMTGEWAIEDMTGSESALGLTTVLFGICIAAGGLGWSVGADFWARNRLLWLSGSGGGSPPGAAGGALCLLFYQCHWAIGTALSGWGFSGRSCCSDSAHIRRLHGCEASGDAEPGLRAPIGVSERPLGLYWPGYSLRPVGCGWFSSWAHRS